MTEQQVEAPRDGAGEQALDARVSAAMERVGSLLDAEPRSSRPKVADFHVAHREVEDALRAVIEALRSGTPAGDGLWPTLVELHQVQRELVEQRLVQRLEALERVGVALARLRELGPLSEILRVAPEQLAQATGLDRVLLSRVKDARLVGVGAHFAGDADGAERALAALEADPLRLEYPVAEAEMMRRRRATIVRTAGASPQAKRPPLPVGPSYVAAPVVLDGAAIGFFHGSYAEREVESLERDATWAFADGFAQVFERAVLRRRVREQRRRLRRLVEWTDVMAGELSDSAIELEPAAESEAPERHETAGEAGRSRLEDLLTRRELDVLRLMARGDSNRAIATELVVSEGTVKFHVKNVLRKLGVGNRVEATTRYLQLMGS
jgi:LuxR family transcriptional regulator, regulator of acetate metabolism